MIKIRVPASTANLGPGFDCLGMALDVWNQVTFEVSDSSTFTVNGEGQEKLNHKMKNLLTRSYARLHDLCGKKMNEVSIDAHNQILLSSGLGSSAAAIIAGLMGANEMLGAPLHSEQLLDIATGLEGHPDNVAAALLGGLVVSFATEERILTRRYDMPDLSIVVIKPLVDWPTRMARTVLPKSYSRVDAVFNLGRVPMVVNALREGDIDMLQKAMDDRIHQPYRLKHIEGGMAAIKAAKEFGAAALSGAGPSILAILQSQAVDAARSAMTAVFEERGIRSRALVTRPSNLGCQIEHIPTGQ